TPPDRGSKKRPSTFTSVVLPQPLPPTMPTHSPASIRIDTFCRTDCRDPYPRATPQNSTVPRIFRSSALARSDLDSSFRSTTSSNPLDSQQCTMNCLIAAGQAFQRRNEETQHGIEGHQLPGRHCPGEDLPRSKPEQCNPR